jgi:hypothetical protein
MTLNDEQTDQYPQGDGDDVGFNGRGDKFQTFHRTQDGNGWGDDAVAIEQGCPYQTDHNQQATAAVTQPI